MTPRATVLLIGDGASSAGELAEVLAGRGYRVVRAAGEAEAVRAALRDEPEAILVHLELPDPEGVELVQALQAAVPGAAVAAVVASEGDAAVTRAREAGLTLTEHFPEPVDVEAIESWLEDAVGGG